MARSRSETAITAWSKRVIIGYAFRHSRQGGLEGGQHFARDPLELAYLVIGSHPEGDGRSSCLDKRPDLLYTLLRGAVGDPPLQPLPVVVGVVVGVEELLGLVQCRLPILAHVDVVVEAGLEVLPDFASILRSVAPYEREVFFKALRSVPRGLPAVTVAGDASQGRLDVPLLGRIGVGDQPDGNRLLDGTRQYGDVLELIVLAIVADVLLGG